MVASATGGNHIEAAAVVRLREACDDTVHLVMELCVGGQLLYRIVTHGHYSEQAAGTIIGVVWLFHANRVKWGDDPWVAIHGKPKTMDPFQPVPTHYRELTLKTQFNPSKSTHFGTQPKLPIST